MSEALPSSVQRCCLCDRGLADHILRDPRGGLFCREHLPAVRLCRYCHRGFLDTGQGTVCGSCRAAAVTTDAKAQWLVKIGPLAWFERHGLTTGTGAQRIRVTRSMPPHGSGREMFGYVKYQPKTEVVLRRGLPTPVLLVVAAHELGHLWLAEARASISATMAEGVCDWLSWRYAQDTGDAECAWLARKLKEHADTSIGTAFREMRLGLGEVSPALLPSLLPLLPRRVVN